MTGLTGVLKTWKPEKGFGFLKVDGGATGGRDVFLHVSILNASKVEGEIKEGLRFTFDVEQTAKGVRALNVKRAD